MPRQPPRRGADRLSWERAAATAPAARRARAITGRPTVKIAVWQALSTSADIDANLDRLGRAAAEAAASGAELLITPEMFLTGYNIGDATRTLAAEAPLDRLGEIAAAHGIGLIAGGPAPAAHGCHNAAAFIAADGSTLAVYRKTHLFGDLDRAQFLAGDEPTTMVEYRGLKIAMLICYDVEFPEAVRAAALAGADLVAVPTAQMQPFSFVNLHLIPTRAWESQIYVAYANQHGIDGDLEYVGLSTIAAPDGNVLARAEESGEEIIYAEVDAATVAAARQANPYLDDLRRELFR
nr:carbon-nitrogen hydrolase family protein [Sediminivirga luteola]